MHQFSSPGYAWVRAVVLSCLRAVVPSCWFQVRFGIWDLGFPLTAVSGCAFVGCGCAIPWLFCLLSILYARSASALRAFPRYAILANVKRLVLFLILLGSLGCGKNLERQVQEQVRTFDQASLSDQQVEVLNVQEIGDHAVAEVRITTAVRLVKKDGTWVIEEFRIGDRRWERAEHILAVINEKRTETTLQQMDLITEGIRRYTALNHQIPQVSSFEDLMDLLSPQFQDRVVRIDAWSNPFSYQTIGTDKYDLKSAGPDGNLETPDDLVVRSQ